MKNLKLMKFAIGGLMTVMMLGTALFSVQAFTGGLQSNSFLNETYKIPDIANTADIASMEMSRKSEISTAPDASTIYDASADEYNAETVDISTAEISSQEGSSTPNPKTNNDPPQTTEHSMDSQSQPSGFLAVPWIPVSFIRQAMTESPFLQQAQRFLRDFSIKPYPLDKTAGVTDKAVRNLSNLEYSIQALTLHISKLTAS